MLVGAAAAVDVATDVGAAVVALAEETGAEEDSGAEPPLWNKLACVTQYVQGVG